MADDTTTPEKELQLSEKQNAIFSELNQIGHEIAAFYLDGIRIISDKRFQTRVYLLAHIYREIDGSIRDILATKSTQDKKKTLGGDEVENLRKEINKKFQSKGLKELDNINGHVTSVCNALETDVPTNLAKRWITCSVHLHALAHRHGAYKTPRDFDIFQDIWNEYENVLYDLFGENYPFLSRLDNLLEKPIPSDEIIGALRNILQNEARERYFFGKLNKISWLNKLNSAGFFSPEKNPKPKKVEKGYTLPYWSALAYVERMSPLAQEPSEEMNIILSIVHNIVNYREAGKKIDNSRTDFMLFKILCNIPLSKLTLEHMNYIEDCLSSDFHNSLIAAEIGKTLLPKLALNHKKELLQELLRIITLFRVNDKSFSKIEPLIEEYWFKEIIDTNLATITYSVPQEAYSLILMRIKEILKNDEHAFSVSAIPTIEDHPQRNDDFEVYLIKLLTASIDKLPNKKEMAEQLLNEEITIFKRIALHYIGKHFADLKDLFFGMRTNPFDIPFCNHELYEFMAKNTKQFSEEEIQSLIHLIEEKEYYIPPEIKDDGDKKNKLLAYRKKELLSALLSSENKIIKEKYKHYEAIDSSPLEHPGFITWHETWMGHFSPTTKEDLSKLSSEEIVKFLSEFKEERGVKTPSEMGLAETFESLVFDDPEKYSKEVQTYVNVKSIYIYSLIKAFTDAWNKNKEFDWKAVLEYIEKIVESGEFIKDQKGEFYYPDWVIAQIARLIEEGAHNDGHAFDVALLPLASKILISINKLVQVQESDTDDAVTHTLNTTKGKILSALLNLSLRIARTSKSEPKWLPELKSIFDKELSDNPSLELNTTIAEYMPNFLYLDKDWVLSNITKIFPQEKDAVWMAAMQGYLFGSKVYKDLFHVMKKTGNYEKGLSISISKRDMSERLVSHICIAYIEGWEKLEEKSDLIYSLMYDHKEHASEVIHFFWMHRKLIKEEQIPLIKRIWQELFSNQEDNAEVMAESLKLLEFFKVIDDGILAWCLVGGKSLKHQDSYFIVEILASLVEDNPEQVGKIFLQITENIDILPDYKQEDIILIVKKLYEKKQKEIANKICNKYGSENVHFLREIYIENQKNS